MISKFEYDPEGNLDPQGIQKLLEALHSCSSTGENSWIATCPVCDNKKTPKLAIRIKENGFVQLHCYRSSHSRDEIIEALGLSSSDLKVSSVQSALRELQPVWNSLQAFPESKTLTRLFRRFERNLTTPRLREFASALKLPTQTLLSSRLGYCPDRRSYVIPETNTHGEIIGLQYRNKDGVKRTHKGSMRGLVGIEQLDPDGVLHICEGFSDTAALRSLGFTNVIGRPSATGGVDLLVQLVKSSRYDYVVIVSDPKPAEQQGAQQLGKALASFVEFKIITPPDGMDARAWINSGATKKNVENLIQAAECRSDKLNVLAMSSIPKRKVNWLWKNRIALGKLTILAGDPGLGKSFITTYLAACVSSGTGWHVDSSSRQCVGDVIFLSAEDDPGDTIRPRLEVHGANLDRVFFVPDVTCQSKNGSVERAFALTHDLAKLERVLRSKPRCRLIVIDPISAYMGNIDTYKDSEVRSVLGPLAKLAAKYSVAVVAVAHLNKGDNTQPLYRVVGSIGIIAAARTAWLVMKDPDNEDRRFVLPAKNNIGPDKGIGMAYSLINKRVVWGTEVIHESAAEMMERASREAESSSYDEAIAFLEVALSDGPLSANDVIKRANTNGISRRTLVRAKKALHIKSKKHGSGKDAIWYWRLRNDDRAFVPPPAKIV